MSAAPGGGPQRLYHDRTQLWRKLGVVVYACCIASAGPLFAVIVGQEPLTLAFILAGADITVIATACVLVFRSGFRVGADGVTIVYPYGLRRHLPWEQVRMFAVRVRPPQRARVEYGAWVVRHDATDVTTSSCCRTVPVNKNSCPEGITRLAADLEGERQRLGQASLT